MNIAEAARERHIHPYLLVQMSGQNITSALNSDLGVSGLEVQLDYPELTAFKAANVTLRLSNIDGQFTPGALNNFWTQYGDTNIPAEQRSFGLNADVTIDAGFTHPTAGVLSERLFRGIVVDVDFDANTLITQLTIADKSADLLQRELTDFGLARWLALSRYETGGTETSLTGSYHVKDFMTPLSRESVTEIQKATGTLMDIVDEIDTEGIIDANHVSVNVGQGEIETEGGVLPATDRPLTLKFKEPYRYTAISKIMKEIVTAADIPVGSIELGSFVNTTRFCASHGRPGWAAQWRGDATAAGAWGWDGVGKDFIVSADGSEAIFTYGSRQRQNSLIHYDFETDTWTPLVSPSNPNATETENTNDPTLTDNLLEMWQLASADFETICFLATYDSVYDSTLPGRNQAFEGRPAIFKYVRSTGTVTQIADGEYAQMAMPYPNAPITAIHPRLSLYPDTRKGFEVVTIGGTQYLYFIYHGAQQNEIGLKRVNLGTDTTETIYTHYSEITNDPNRLFYYGYDFAMDVDAGIIYHLLCQQPAQNCQVRTTNLAGTSTPSTIAYRDDATRKFIAFTNIVLDGDDGLWGVAQRLESGGAAQVSTSGAIWYVDFENNTWTRLTDDLVDFPTGPTGGVGLAGKAYYFEGSIYPWAALAYVGPAKKGVIIECTQMSATAVARGWVSFFAEEVKTHTNCISRMAVRGDGIFLIVGFGPYVSINDIKGYLSGAPVLSLENFALLEFTHTCPLKIPQLPLTRESAWETLTQLARVSNATIGMEDGEFIARPRSSLTLTPASKLESAMGMDDLGFIVTDDSLPLGIGFVLIDSEIIEYSNSNIPYGNTDFIVINDIRGQYGSDPAPHANQSPIYLIDPPDVIVDAKNLMTISEEPDFDNIYNTITVEYGTDNIAYRKAAASVAAYGEHPLVIPFPELTHHERVWAERLAETYLTEHKDVHKLYEIQLKWSPNVKLNDLLVLHEPVRLKAKTVLARALRINHNFNDWTTTVTAREVLY